MARRKDFFISYTKTDKTWAEWIAWTLEEAGYTTVIQAWDFGPGANFVLEMNAATKQSKQILLVLSKDYLKSEFAASEWAAGFVDDPRGERRRLLPVRVRECRPNGLLEDLVYTDLVGLPESEARQRLLDALKPRLKPQHAPAFPGSTTRPSYPGSRAKSRSTSSSGAPAGVDARQAAETLFRSVIDRPVAEVPAGHYAEVARLLASGKLIPFLGLGVHFEVHDKAWGAQWSPSSDFFPSTREYGTYLAQHLDERERVESGMELARIYQFLDETRGRVFVQSTVHRLYNRDYPIKAAHAFLASLNTVVRASGRGKTLPLIATTNLDDVLEGTFRRAGEPFAVASYVSEGADKGRLLFRSPAGETRILRTTAQVRKAAKIDSTVVVKLHGGVDRRDPARESMVLTEDEIVSYFGSPAVRELLPELFMARVGNPRFLFLGYSLRDWNVRFLLAELWNRRRPDMSWAVRYNTTGVTRTLWGKRGVEIVDVPIEQYLSGLGRELTSPAKRTR